MNSVNMIFLYDPQGSDGGGGGEYYLFTKLLKLGSEKLVRYKILIIKSLNYFL